ncbi:hypothetical protein ANN_15343 [Periplaneta americana]|uniref:Transposase Tc1-like domain-containing protein n=1 Tax=Periplaneta americana TaxID=6978 RepID=A0ABQ8SHA0_PERAM|nr:hypothetical protein ANN_15343 [Periplaneta americana]
MHSSWIFSLLHKEYCSVTEISGGGGGGGGGGSGSGGGGGCNGVTWLTEDTLLSLVREAGFSATEASRGLGVHDSTARRWVRLSREGIGHRQPGSGRRRVSTRAHQSASSIKVNPHFPGSSLTVIRRLWNVGRYPRVAAMKGCITDDHRLFRLAFAEENNFDWNKITSLDASYLLCSFCRWITVENERVPHDPCFFCQHCFLSYNYVDGKKIGKFKAYPFYDKTAM